MQISCGFTMAAPPHLSFAPRSALLIALKALVLLSCDRPHPSTPPRTSSHSELEKQAAPAPPVSPFRVIAEGANGNDEYYSPMLGLCPVRGAVLLCGHGPLIQASPTTGLTIFDEHGADEVHGRWPSQLWILSREDGFAYAAQQTTTGWVQRARLGSSTDVSVNHQSASWGDGGLAILTTGFHNDARTGFDVADVTVQTISRDGKVFRRSVNNRQGQLLVTYVFSIHSMGSNDLIAAGQTGGKGVMDGTPALFVWRGSSLFPERIPLPDDKCHINAIHGAPDDVRIFGQRNTQGSVIPCGYRLMSANFVELSLPSTGRDAISYSRSPDGTEWLVLHESKPGVLGSSTLWTHHPNAPWEPAVMPLPVLARTKHWGPILPQRVHVADDGRVWVGAVYRERCGRAIIMATDATAPPCRIGMSNAFCTATPEQEHKHGVCPEVRAKGETWDD